MKREILNVTLALAGLFAVFFLAQFAGDRVRAQSIGTVSALPSQLPYGQAGQPYNHQVFGFGPWTVLSGAIPPGLTLSGNLLTGTPTAEGDYTWLMETRGPISAVFFGSDVTATACIYSSALVFITPHPALPASGVAYSFQLNAAGGTPPYTFAVASGTLPAGLTLSASGLISGTPTAPAPIPTVEVQFRVQDSSKVTCYGNPPSVPRVANATAAL